MTEERIKKLRKAKRSITIEEFCKLAPIERKQLDLFENSKELDDCEKAIQVFPLIDLKVEYFVDGEKEVAVGDFLTYKFTIT